MKPQPQSHSSVERIPVVKSGRKVLVPIDQIRYIEAKDDYSCIYTETDRFLSTISLAKLEQKLAPHGFFRVHRGYIVNLEYVEDVEVISSGILQLGVNGIEGKKISVSRRRVVASSAPSGSRAGSRLTAKRFDIISDTHGFLSPELLSELAGADVIVHAGDMCSASDYRTLSDIARSGWRLGNNDWAYDYGPMVKERTVFLGGGLRWQVTHYRRRLNLQMCDIAIFGHNHTPVLERDEWTACWS